MSTPHIEAKHGEIAEKILLPGDPLRAEYIADTFLEEVTCYNKVRNMLGFTGTYKGKRVSVQGSGMGIPSISIYVHELISVYGVKSLIRVGTCGSLQEDVKVRDVVLAMTASTDSAVNHARFGNIDFSPCASPELFVKAWNRARELGIDLKAGNILSSDTFYGDDENWWKKLADYGVICAEMETTGLYTLAAKFKAEALTLLTVSDSILSGESCSPEERQTSFEAMMKLALDII